MIRKWYRQWKFRCEVKRRLIAFAKTKAGRQFIEAAFNNNQILADYAAHAISAENPYAGQTLRIRLPNDDWRKLNAFQG